MAPEESLESLRHSFNRSLRVQGKADRTLTLYGQSIVYFSRWLSAQGMAADLSSLTRTNALKWLDSLRERGQTTGTVRTRWPIGIPLVRGDEAPGRQAAFRPTNLMQRLSQEIEQHPGQLTKNQAARRAGGRRATALLAFDLLDAEGYLMSERGRSGYPVYMVIKPYRENDDPLSDRYVNVGNAFQSA
jgi:hypothetical protein